MVFTAPNVAIMPPTTYVHIVLQPISPYASVSRRIIARFIDFGLVWVPLNALALMALIFWRSLPVAIGLLLLEAIYKPLLEARWGATLGKKWMKMKVVDRTTGRLMDINQSLYRYLPWAFSVCASVFVFTRYFQDPAFADVTDLEAYVDFANEHVLNESFLLSLVTNLTVFSAVWMFSDPMVRALHDRIAGTVVINDVEALEKEKEKKVGWGE